MISNRLSSIKPSATLAIDAKANALIKAGRPILKFGLGEPDFDTPEFIKEAAAQAIKDGKTKYTAVAGVPELRAAIAGKFERENKIICKPEEVMATTGAKQALYNIFMALLNPGDEVIVPSPYWVSYADMVQLAEGKVVTIDTTSTGFVPTPESIEGAITPRTKILVLNSPSNPTGAVIPRKILEKIAEIAVKHNIFVISDEVYEHFIYDGVEHCSIGSLPGMSARTFTVNAASKTYAMTGWRLGFVTGPKDIISAMTNIQGHSTSNPSSVSQYAALAALTDPRGPASVEAMRNEYAKRREVVYEGLRSMPGLELEKPMGAFYAFPKIKQDSFEFCEMLLEKANVAVVPGGAFGKEGNHYFRFSYASSMEAIQEGLLRIRGAL
jgi:aspartate aminotransferase